MSDLSSFVFAEPLLSVVRFPVCRIAHLCLLPAPPLYPILGRGTSWQASFLLGGNEIGEEQLKSSSETGLLIGSLEEVLGDNGDEVFF